MKAAVIDDNGNVLNIIVADAAVDTLPGFTLINCSDEVTTRHRWTGSEFVPNLELQAEIEASEASLNAAIESEAWEVVE